MRINCKCGRFVRVDVPPYEPNQTEELQCCCGQKYVMKYEEGLESSSGD